MTVVQKFAIQTQLIAIFLWQKKECRRSKIVRIIVTRRCKPSSEISGMALKKWQDKLHPFPEGKAFYCSCLTTYSSNQEK